MAALPHRQSSPSKHSSSSEDAHSIANSTAPLTAAYRPPQKDFGAAFAALQGRYGMGNDLPTPSGGTPPKKKKEQQERKPSPRRHSSSHAQPPPASGSASRAYQRRPVSIDTARALASQSAGEDDSQTPISDGAASGAGQGDKDTSSPSFRWKRLFGFLGKDKKSK